MPTRTPTTGVSLSAMISRTRSAAASVRLMIGRGIGFFRLLWPIDPNGSLGQPRLYRRLPIYTPDARKLPPVQRNLRFFGHPALVPRRIVDHVHRDALDALDGHRSIFHP